MWHLLTVRDKSGQNGWIRLRWMFRVVCNYRGPCWFHLCRTDPFVLLQQWILGVPLRVWEGFGRWLPLSAGGTLNREAEGAFFNGHAAISKEITGVWTLFYSSEPDLYLPNKGQRTKQTQKIKTPMQTFGTSWRNTLTREIQLVQLTQRLPNESEDIGASLWW